MYFISNQVCCCPRHIWVNYQESRDTKSKRFCTYKNALHRRPNIYFKEEMFSSKEWSKALLQIWKQKCMLLAYCEKKKR